MIVRNRNWIAVVGLLLGLVVWGAWLFAPVVYSAGEYVGEQYKEVRLYLDVFVGDPEIGFGSTSVGRDYRAKGGELR